MRGREGKRKGRWERESQDQHIPENNNLDLNYKDAEDSRKALDSCLLSVRIHKKVSTASVA